MSFWKVVLSKISGKKPSISLMDNNTLGWNERDGILFGLKDNGSGVKVVTPINFNGTIGPNGPQTVTEVLSGPVNGVNRIFSTSLPYRSGHIDIYLNGLKEVFFVESSETTITLDDPPKNTVFIDRIESVFTLKT